MANYHAMNREELAAEKAALEAEYKKFQAKGLKLNMARGKPGPHQMDLAMDLLKMNDYTTDAGTDARNYGELEGLQEARVLFADVFGVQPGEVFVGGNSSLQLMYNPVSYTHLDVYKRQLHCSPHPSGLRCGVPVYGAGGHGVRDG